MATNLFEGNKKWYWVGGGIGAIALIYYMHKKNQAAAAAAATTTSTDTSSTDTSGTGYDSSGYDYGQYGYDSGYYGSGYGGYYGGGSYLGSYTDPSTGTVITGGGTTTGTGTGTVTAPTTNAEWTQQAIAFLSQEGYDASTVAAALGAYIGGAGLTSDQMSIVQAALAAEGNPPQSVPAPHLQSPPPGQGSGGATGGTTGGGTTPTQLATPVLRVASVVKGKSATLAWNAIPGTNFYQINLGIPGASYVYARTEGTSLVVTKTGSYHMYAVPPGNQNTVVESHYSNSVTVSF